ncbi:dihydropteroate synthase [Candidatus Saccharibacteria bacterium]|nr:MAG: dihydropteroate synthase [Candidatus Saccharibacteria bacterium]
MTTQLVGILNITPDSFSDGGLFLEPTAALQQLKQLFDDGASLVDIGAESTRPGAEALTPEQEWQRLAPVLEVALSKYPNRISLDTFHPETVSRAAAEFGAHFIVNDVTGFSNPAMVQIAAKHKLRCIVSHLPRESHGDIQAAHKGLLVDDEQVVRQELLRRYDDLVAAGVPAEGIILDPGIGFGKTPELNRRLLRFAELVPHNPVMIGYSRKRFLGEHRFETEPNLAAGRIAVATGAAYLRVHDVAAHRGLL